MAQQRQLLMSLNTRYYTKFAAENPRQIRISANEIKGKTQFLMYYNTLEIVFRSELRDDHLAECRIHRPELERALTLDSALQLPHVTQPPSVLNAVEVTFTRRIIADANDLPAPLGDQFLVGNQCNVPLLANFSRFVFPLTPRIRF